MVERVVAIKSAVTVWEGDEPCEIPPYYSKIKVRLDRSGAIHGKDH